jgi:hypothetical protein
MKQKIKHVFLLIIIVLAATKIEAQTTQGTDFWLTFGDNARQPANKVNLQIRVVATAATNLTFTFTNISGVGHTETQFLVTGEVYTLDLSAAQKTAVYIPYSTSGVTSKSVHIASTEPVTVFALNQENQTTDATNVLPVNALGKEYYHISYICTDSRDGYNIVATKDGTIISENGVELNPTTPLSIGQVWTVYSSIGQDMTGRHITANHPVAYFSSNEGVLVPKYESGITYYANTQDNLFQQMLPVRTWGKHFCIPVTNRGVERVRIVASQNGTIITHQGGTVKVGSTTLDKGQFVELEIILNAGGCFISANKPVGVCSYMVTQGYAYDNGAGGADASTGDASIAWVPPVEQFVDKATIAPFIPNGTSTLSGHYALLVMPTDGCTQTTLSIGGATPAVLSSGTWKECINPDYSFYNIQLTQSNQSYTFANPKGLLVLGYGKGSKESYYYLAASSALDLEAAFYVNGENYLDINGKEYCNIKKFNIKAVLENASTDAGFLKWFVDGVERTDVEDQLEWLLTTQVPGDHIILMRVTDLDDQIKTYETKITLCPLTIPVNHRYRN